MTLWRRLFMPGRLDREIDAELHDHVERQIEDYRSRGLTEAQARRRALAEFGGVDQSAESCRDVWHGRLMQTVAQDLRYGIRVLRKSPAFTAVAVLSLALGIGAITAIYSLVDAVLLRTLPVRAPEELVLLSQRMGTRDGFSFTTGEFRGLAAHDALAGLCAFRPWPGFRLSTDRGAELAMGQLVSGNCFEVLGLPPAMGRLLQPDDDRGPGGPLVAVISHDFWQRHFHGRADVVGQAFDLMGQPFTVVGVTPREFFGLEPGRAIEITVPLSVQPLLLPGTPLLTSADARWLRLIGRPAGDVERLRAELGRTWSLLETVRVRPADERPTLALLSGAQGLNELRRTYSLPLRLLLAAVTVLLLVACANLAGLLLARAKARQHEIGLRLSLGASRARIVRQMLTEAMLLSLLGSVAGLALAYWGRAAVLDLLSRGTRTIVLDAPVDARLLAFTICIMAATTLLFGLWPALRATAEASHQHLRTTTRTTGRQTAALIAAQTALAAVLVSTGALFLRSLTALHAVDTGFKKERVLLASIRPAVGGAQELEARPLYRDLYTRFTHLADVRAVTLMLDTPLGGRSMIAGIDAVGGRGPAPRVQQAHFNVVGPRFLETMGVPIVGGRDFVETDDERSTPKAIVGASLARHLFGADSAVGRQLVMDGRRFEIVGVAADVRYESLREEPGDTVYFTYFHMTEYAEELTFALRTDGNPLALADAVRQQVRDVSPRLPIYKLSSLDATYDASIATERLLATIAAFLASLALLLVSVGVYGTLAYAAARRTREMGVRLALGAQRADITRLLVTGALAPVTIGLAVGLPSALVASRLAQGILFGIAPSDPMTFATVSALLLLTATMAAAIPARRASGTDPMVALREEP
jgi:predicted permease